VSLYGGRGVGVLQGWGGWCWGGVGPCGGGGPVVAGVELLGDGVELLSCLVFGGVAGGELPALGVAVGSCLFGVGDDGPSVGSDFVDFESCYLVGVDVGAVGGVEVHGLSLGVVGGVVLRLGVGWL